MAENLQPTVEIEDTAAKQTGQPQQSSAQTAQQPQQQPPRQQPPVMGCTGDCRRCNEYQRGFCASQIPYNMQQPLARIEQTVTALMQAVSTLGEITDALTAKVDDLQRQIDAQRQPKEQDLFTPEAPKKGKVKSEK